jgi:23S rRNA pseudouridine1911/1915/1917 synthase
MSDDSKKTKTQTLEDHVLHTLGYGPRSKVKKAFQEKKILLNGRPAARTSEIKTGDKVEILSTEVFQKDQAAIVPNTGLRLPAAGSSKDWVAICKPAGMKPHPLHPAEQDTALNFLGATHPEVAEPYDAQRPLQGGLIHRLDVGTSGLLFAARSSQAWQALRSRWTGGSTEKVYLAWATGELKTSGIVECGISTDPKSAKRMRLAPDSDAQQKNQNLWPSRTAVYPLFSTTMKVTPDGSATAPTKITLVLVRIFTGVRHQIRVTLQGLGHPVLADPIYKEQASAQGLSSLRPLPPEQKKSFEALSQRIAEHMNIFHDFEIAHQIKPHALPQGGFFLHALWARNPEIAGLEEGLYCPPPDYF